MPYKIDSALHRTFLKRIRQRRVELGLTQQQVADKLDISCPGYNRIESGIRTPGLGVVERVAKALQTSAADLLSEESVPSR